jgi:hypothetical protein
MLLDLYFPFLFYPFVCQLQMCFHYFATVCLRFIVFWAIFFTHRFWAEHFPILTLIVLGIPFLKKKFAKKSVFRAKCLETGSNLIIYPYCIRSSWLDFRLYQSQNQYRLVSKELLASFFPWQRVLFKLCNRSFDTMTGPTRNQVTLTPLSCTSPLSTCNIFTQVILIWILKFPLQVVSVLLLNNLQSCKGKSALKGASLGGGGVQTNRGETFYPSKGQISPQNLRYIIQ